MKNYNKVLIIYNPNAMKGKIDEFLPHIKQRLLLRFEVVDAMYSPIDDGAESLAYKNANNYDIIIACGGDGTVNQIVNGVIKSGSTAVIGILPFGTSNDLAKTLEIPEDLNKSIDAILRLNITKFDLMFDGERYITSSFSTGYLTNISYQTTTKAKKKMGRFAYFLSCLKYLFKLKALPITVTCDTERIHDKFVYFTLINTTSVNGMSVNKNDDYANGKVKLVLIKKSKFLGSFFTMLKLYLKGINSIRKSKLITIRDVVKTEIENHSNSPFTLDGEKVKFLKKTVVVNSVIDIIKN